MDFQRLIDTLKTDEGFRPVAYWDREQWTYGYGTRAPAEGATITREKAEIELQKHIDIAVDGFKRMFKGQEHKFNEVREECFIQLIFNMGTGRPGGGKGLYGFKNTLAFIFNNANVPWESVADGLKNSLWFSQVGDSGDGEGRGKRIVRQVRTGQI